MRARIREPLLAHNEVNGGPANPDVLAISVRDPAGGIVGGLWGRIGYGFLFVEVLALGPAKARGLGRRIMMMAEAEAVSRGLTGIWLDTWTFQAPDFHRKLGFAECGRVRDYPPGHDRIFFVKRL